MRVVIADDHPLFRDGLRSLLEARGIDVVGEQDTKAVLIDPVLRALGWDVEDLDEVQREYRLKSGDNPVDYALSILRTPRLFVEAKALGGNLNDRRWDQIMGYAAVAGVEWVVLTNGAGTVLEDSRATHLETGLGSPQIIELVGREVLPILKTWGRAPVRERSARTAAVSSADRAAT